MRKFTVTVNGQDYDVVVKDGGAAAAAPAPVAAAPAASDRFFTFIFCQVIYDWYCLVTNPLQYQRFFSKQFVVNKGLWNPFNGAVFVKLHVPCQKYCAASAAAKYTAQPVLSE